MFRLWMAVLLLPVAAAFTGCGISAGDDDGGGGRVSPKGTEYFGTYEDDDGDLFQINVIFGNDGNIGDIQIDGVSMGWTGEVQHEEGDIFSFSLSNGEIGGFFAKGNHGAFITQTYDIGALRKNATALASAYAMSDIAGSWTGYTVEVDSAFEIEDRYGSEVTINADGSFDGSDDNGVKFSDRTPLSLSSATYGRYLGQSVDSTLTYISSVRAFLAPDKEFAAVAACYGTFPDHCTLSAWEKD